MRYHPAMRVAWLLALVLLAGCSAAAPPAVLSGDDLARAVQASGIPVANVRAFSAESDPNKLLGRPNQYTAKVSWQDTRAGEGADDATAELFANTADLAARRTYTTAISTSGGAFAQYIYANEPRRLLLRLPHQLTPDQAAGYEAWLATL